MQSGIWFAKCETDPIVLPRAFFNHAGIKYPTFLKRSSKYVFSLIEAVRPWQTWHSLTCPLAVVVRGSKILSRTIQSFASRQNVQDMTFMNLHVQACLLHWLAPHQHDVSYVLSSSTAGRLRVQI